MSDRQSSVPTLRQTLAVLGLAIVVASALYSGWFRACCMDSVRGLIAVLFLPAMLIQLVLGAGSIHDSPVAGFYVGTFVQFYLLLWLYRWLRSRRRVA